MWSDFNTGERGSAPQGGAAQRPADARAALRRVRGDDRGRHPAAARARRHRGRLRGAAHVVVGHADVGVVDELLDDDRPRGRHRLQPLHRQPLPRGTRRGQGRDRRDREHDVDRGQGRVPLGAHRRALARGGVPRAGDGVPFDGPRHDPVGRRRGARRPHAAARGARRPRRQGARHPGQEGSRHRRREPLGPLDRRRVAPPRHGPRDRPGAPRRARDARARHAPRHARRPGRRPGQHQPRRLRPARRRRSGPARPRPRSSPSPPPTRTPS